VVRREADRCPDDLLARSRRGALSAVEQRALDAHLGLCSLCRAAVALGVIYDDGPDAVQPGDDAVVARLASRVAGASGRRRFPRTVAVAAAVPLLVLAGGAAAWVMSRHHPQPRPEAPPAARSVAVGSAASAPRRPDPGPQPVPESVLPLAVHKTQARARRGGSSSSEAAGRDDGAAALFAAANAARRSGDLRAAIVRYQLIERRYPTSPEAGVSRVSAGDLLVRLGDPAAALDEFDAYRARGPSQDLAPEALFGRARCLQALGRVDEERAAWHEMLGRFPGSIYVSAARVRLDELER
jgi:TolA-binding protein